MPIPGVSQITIPLISQVTMQPLIQYLPDASNVKSIPMIPSTPQIPIAHPSVPYMQVPFQGLSFRGIPQSQFI